MRVIPASSYRRMRWKNGGGETIEIAVSPEGASIHDFDWRVSMARIEAAGPFSIFPGVDRTLVVLDGCGIKLRFSNAEAVHVARFSGPYSFPGDVPVEATLTDGSIMDLNVMTRRGRIRHRVSRITLDAQQLLACQSDECLLVVTESAVRLCGGDHEIQVQAGDAVYGTTRNAGVDLCPTTSAAIVHMIEFWRQ